MRRTPLALIASLWLPGMACAQSPVANDPDSIAREQVIALVDVHVVPMDRDTVLRRRTVLIRAGRIEWIRDWSEQVPAEAIVIEGRGRYLLPGLIDMHVHARRADIPLYRAAGITTVRNMWGHDAVRQLMQDIAQGSLVGPTIISASPGLDAPPVQWPFTQVVQDTSLARRVVQDNANAGWSFIKVYTNLEPAVYDAVLSAARNEGIRVIGHVPARVTIEHALASGLTSIEHFTGYDRAVSSSGRGGTFGWADADTTRFARLVSLTTQNEVWNCPTLAIYGALAEPQGQAARERVVRNRRAFLRQLAQAGAALLAGTDAGIDVVPAGFTLQTELEEFVAAGLRPFRALQAATTDAARFLRVADIGAIKPGNRADLVLLAANPLEDISATRRISGVMFAGRWLAARALAAQ
jgi:imidazolonepropionase-like amidohydrolase